MGLLDSVKSGMSTAIQKGKNTMESVTLIGFGIPSPVVSWYQNERRALGIATPTGSTLFVVAFTMYAIFAVVVAFAVRMLYRVFGFIWANTALRIILLIFLFIVVSYLIYYRFIKKDKSKDVFTSADQDFLGVFRTKKEGFQTAADTFPELDMPLVNLQPLAVKQVAFIGPSEKGGKFNIKEGVQGQIKSGLRFLTFQVDYLDMKKDPNDFGEPFDPILIYRNDSGELISVNSADINAIANELATYAFSESVVNSTLPLVIYLHFVRTPSTKTTKDQIRYLEFLNNTAKAFSPLSQYLLTSIGEGGVFTRQTQENILFKTPIGSIQNKVVFLTNVDTKRFNSKNLDGMPAYGIDSDLDYIVHARVYAETEEDSKIGVTQVSTAIIPPTAVLVSYDRILKLTDKEKELFAKRGQNRFVIAMPSQMKNPKSKDLNDVLNTLGVNVIPLNIFGEDMDELKKKVSIWKENQFLHFKPGPLQSTSGAVSPAS
jgi:hypothetical protein